MGYSYLAFGAGKNSGMNVRCNLNDLLPVHMCFNVIRLTLHYICKNKICNKM